eukprot:scaffold38851_cov20-Tisochrysis_lutea.AAC.2
MGDVKEAKTVRLTDRQHLSRRADFVVENLKHGTGSLIDTNCGCISNPHQRTHSELCPQLHVRPNSPRVSLLWINDTASTDFGQAAYDRGRIDVGIEVKSLP